MKAIMVRFADDAMCLCHKGQGRQMYQLLKRWIENHGLKLNEEKTCIVDFHQEHLEFLGFRLSRRKAPSGKYYPHTEPSPKSCNKLREAIRQETTRSTLWKEPEQVFEQVNQRVRGWSQYFHYRNSTIVFAKMQRYVESRMRLWLWKKHGSKGSKYTKHYINETLHERYGLVNLPLYAAWKHS